MRLEASGGFDVTASREVALAYLTDPEAVPHCLPGEVHEIEPRDDGGVTVRVRVSHAGASEDLRIRLYVHTVDTDCVTYTGYGLGSRVKVDLDGEFTLRETGDGTRIEWRGAADVGGLLSSLNRGVAGVTVREKLTETADNVRTELEGRAAD